MAQDTPALERSKDKDGASATVVALAALNLFEELLWHLQQKGLLETQDRNDIITMTITDLRASGSPLNSRTADFIDRVFSPRCWR